MEFDIQTWIVDLDESDPYKFFFTGSKSQTQQQIPLSTKQLFNLKARTSTLT